MAPTLVAVGRHDWICPVDQAEEIHRLVAHSRLAIFERSGHSPQVEERAGVHAAPGRYFPVQRTALSDWYTPAKVGIGTKPS